MVMDAEIRCAPQGRPDRLVVRLRCLAVAVDDAVFQPSDSVKDDEIEELRETLKAKVPLGPAIPEEEERRAMPT